MPVPAHYPSASVNHQPACANKKRAHAAMPMRALFCIQHLAAPEKDDVLLWHPSSSVVAPHLQLPLVDQALDQRILVCRICSIPLHTF
jgi:hypothetical protein